MGFCLPQRRKARKKRDSYLYYSSTSSEEELEIQHEEMLHHHHLVDEEMDLAEKESWGNGGEEENTFGAHFDEDGEDDGRMPMSFDRLVSNLTRVVTYACITTLVLLVLIIAGGLFITFLDKWHEERQIQHAYYQAVEECNDKSIRSEQILKACQSARREVGKSVVFGAVKKTFFEMVRSMDACVWYLKSSPAAWLLLAVVLFFFACKLMWPDRYDDSMIPRYMKWFHRARLSPTSSDRRTTPHYKGKRRREHSNDSRREEVAIGMRRRHFGEFIPASTANQLNPVASHTRMHHTNCITISPPPLS